MDRGQPPAPIARSGLFCSMMSEKTPKGRERKCNQNARDYCGSIRSPSWLTLLAIEHGRSSSLVFRCVITLAAAVDTPMRMVPSIAVCQFVPTICSAIFDGTIARDHNVAPVFRSPSTGVSRRTHPRADRAGLIER